MKTESRTNKMENTEYGHIGKKMENVNFKTEKMEKQIN
jgi:hypothetical protein